MYCSTSGFLNVKIVKHVTKEYTAIMLGGGFLSSVLLPDFLVTFSQKMLGLGFCPDVPTLNKVDHLSRCLQYKCGLCMYVGLMEVLLKIIGQKTNISEAVSSPRLYSNMTTVIYESNCRRHFCILTLLA